MWVKIDNPLTSSDYINFNIYPRIFYHQGWDETCLDDGVNHPYRLVKGDRVKDLLDLNANLPPNAIVENLEEVLKEHVDNV